MNYLEIEKVIGREILDSRGNPTAEAEVTLETVPSDAAWLQAEHLPVSSRHWN